MVNFIDIKVELIDKMGTDLRVVDAARVSFDKKSQWEYPSEEVLNNHYNEDITLESQGYHYLEWDTYNDRDVYTRLNDKDKKIVKYLAKHGHWTPFSHIQITLRETIPIFVARQRFKHMVGFTYNEISRRYVDYEPEFYNMGEWRNRPEGSIKQGSANTHIDSISIDENYKTMVTILSNEYNQMIKNGVAPEQARAILPQSMMTSYYVTGSLYAFARAYKLRVDPHAQIEIKKLADEWDRILKPLFPVCWLALTDK